MNKILLSLFLTFFGLHTLSAQEYERYKKLLDTTITSKQLGFNKNITVTVPFEWQENINRDFPLIVVFDRQNQRSHNYILNTIDYLTSNEQMPSAVVISIESDIDHRYYETLHKQSNDKGLAIENERFIFSELIPLAENKFNASSFRVFIGHSRYGYFTSSLLFSRIDELNAVISISPFFIQKNVDLSDSLAQLQNRTSTLHKYYRFAIGNDYPADFAQMDSALQQLNTPFLDAKGFSFEEADHNVTPGLAIGTALYEVFEKWAHLQNKYISNEQKDLTILSSLEEEIHLNYGNRLVFSLGVLNGKGWFFHGEKQYEKAIESWEILMQNYPNFSHGWLFIMDAQLKLGRDTSETTELFKSSLAKSQIYSDQERDELLQDFNTLEK